MLGAAGVKSNQNRGELRAGRNDPSTNIIDLEPYLKRSSRGRADSMASTLKSNREGQRKTRGRTESVTFEQSLPGTLNGPGRPNRPAAWFQPAIPASGQRRSARIAELQHKKGASERNPKPETAPKRKRSSAASHEVKEPPRSKRRKLVQETRKE